MTQFEQLESYFLMVHRYKIQGHTFIQELLLKDNDVTTCLEITNMEQVTAWNCMTSIIYMRVQ